MTEYPKKRRSGQSSAWVIGMVVVVGLFGFVLILNYG